MPATEDIGEVKSVLRSLLIAKGNENVTVAQLNGMYREMEEKNIPYRDFNFSTITEFLRSIPDTLRFYYSATNDLCVSHVDTEKSAHISSLIARQRKPSKKPRKSYGYRPPYNYSRSTNYNRSSNNFNRPSANFNRQSNNYNRPSNNYDRPPSSSVRPTYNYSKPSNNYSASNNYTAPKPAQTYKNAPGVLKLVLEELKRTKTTTGIRKFDVLSKVKEELGQNASYTMQNLNNHLADLSHLVELSEDYIYFRDELAITREIERRKSVEKVIQQPPPVQKDYSYQNESHANEKQEKTSKSFFEEPQVSENLSYTIAEPMDSFCQNSSCTFDEPMSPSMKDTPVSDMIKETTKIRLQKLIENHPEGIWCAELPCIYKSEYNLDLEYHDLGFNSITEFVAALPEIFLIVEPPNTNRQMVLNAKKPSYDSQNNHQRKTLGSVYNFDDYIAQDPDPVPTKLSSGVSRKLFPDGVMRPNETVDQIIVSSLTNKEYIEVNISEIFSPSFFWITLRENKKKLKAMMNEIDEFYRNRDLDVFRIPQVLLESGLNIACTFAKIWHRGIIKKIKPDGFIVILFYDYGTVKTYHPMDLYFLHKKFAVLPAQAIACGLWNTKPIGTSEWSTESRNKFTNKVWNIPMVAIIASTDEENNTMMITLTDTSDDENDLHINDWMVENGLAEWGKMEKTVPIHTMCLYDDRNFPHASDASQENNVKPKESNVENPTLKHDVESLHSTSSVATLVKETQDIAKQTNTITQAILLSLPINKSCGFSNGNIMDLKSITTDISAVLSTDLSSSFNIPKENVSDNNNHFETIRMQGSLAQLEDISKNLKNNSACQSSIKYNNYENEPMESIDHSNEYSKRPSSVHSTNSYPSDYSQSTNEDSNGPQDIDGTISFVVKPDIPMPNPTINIKYPSKFASTFENNESFANVINENIKHSDEFDEGYSTRRPSTSQTNSYLSSASVLSSTPSPMYIVAYLTKRCDEKAIHIFHLDNDGWVCASEIVDAFTDYFNEDILFRVLKAFNLNVTFKRLTRETHPQLFSQLDESTLKAPREENNQIEPNFILTLMTLKSMTQMLIDLGFIKSIMVKENIPLMKKPNSDTEEFLFKRYNNKILFNVLNLVTQYRAFKRSHKS